MELFEEAIECMDLSDTEKKKFLPIWRKHQKIFIDLVIEYSKKQYDLGRDGNVEFLQLSG